VGIFERNLLIVDQLSAVGRMNLFRGLYFSLQLASVYHLLHLNKGEILQLLDLYRKD